MVEIIEGKACRTLNGKFDGRCRQCGYAIYVLWVSDEDPEGKCLEGKSDPMECGEAIRRTRTALMFKQLRDTGLLKAAKGKDDG